MKILSTARAGKDERPSRRERREATRWEHAPSLWRDTSRRLWFPAPVTDLDCDVLIVGGGFTGLWTAIDLKEKEPDVDVVILEAVQPGFGGSGRNGGWCSALFPVPEEELRSRFGPASTEELLTALEDEVDSIGSFIADHGIQCGWVKSGTVTVAVNEQQHLRQTGAAPGRGENLLRADELQRIIRVNGARSAVMTPHCATINPHGLVDGLLDVCRSLGVRIHGGTRVEEVHKEHVIARTDSGPLYATARSIVVAVESYTSRLPGNSRRVAPLYSFMIATEPLDAATWEIIGWEGRETLALAGNMVTFAQRTVDGRIVLGGRGAPYAFGSDIHSSRDTNEQVKKRLVDLLHGLFPATQGVGITHFWGGSLGLARDWMPGVWRDPGTGAVHAAGYAGDGVCLSRLMARAISATVRDSDDPVRSLPICGHRPRNWEPEPLRWLGITLLLRLTALADRAEEEGRRPARPVRWLLSKF